MQELRRFPTLQAEIVAAANEALERFRDDSKKTVLRMVDMEASYLTVDFFRKLPQEAEKGGNPNVSAADRYSEGHFIGSNDSSYVGMVSETLKNTIPKAVVYCQVQEAKRTLLDHFYTQVGKKEVNILLRHLSYRRWAKTLESSEKLFMIWNSISSLIGCNLGQILLLHVVKKFASKPILHTKLLMIGHRMRILYKALSLIVFILSSACSVIG